jgi:hypothetical protein
VFGHPVGVEFIALEADELEFKDLFLFVFVYLVDAVDMLIGNLLDTVLGLERIVFRYVAVFFEALEQFVGIPANVTCGDLMFFTHLANHLDQFFRRSSVSGGMEIRISLPSLDGVRPRSDFKMAFSISLMAETSQG